MQTSPSQTYLVVSDEGASDSDAQAQPKMLESRAMDAKNVDLVFNNELGCRSIYMNRQTNIIFGKEEELIKESNPRTSVQKWLAMAVHRYLGKHDVSLGATPFAYNV